MPWIIFRNTKFVPKSIDRGQTSLSQFGLLRSTTRKVEEKSSNVRYGSWMYVERALATRNRLMPKGDAANGGAHAAIIRLAPCHIFLDHRDEVIRIADFR